MSKVSKRNYGLWILIAFINTQQKEASLWYLKLANPIAYMLPNFPSCGHLAAGFSWLKLWKHSFSSFHGRAYRLFSCYGPQAVFAHSLPWLSHAVVLLLDSGYLVTWFLASHLCRPLSFPRPLPRPWPCTQLEGTYLFCCDRYLFSTACPEKPPVLIIAIDNCTLILPYSILPYPTLPYSSLWFELWTEACNPGLCTC